MKRTGAIDYLEIPARDLEASKRFFTQCFGWTFTDYGPDYAAIEQAGLDGGFYRSETSVQTAKGSALVVLYSTDLDATEAQVKAAGGTIARAIFPFPGGRRFHFCDPSGNEFAVWSDAPAAG